MLAPTYWMAKEYNPKDMQDMQIKEAQGTPWSHLQKSEI